MYGFAERSPRYVFTQLDVDNDSWPRAPATSERRPKCPATRVRLNRQKLSYRVS
jgi:hypothetical protein